MVVFSSVWVLGKKKKNHKPTIFTCLLKEKKKKIGDPAEAGGEGCFWFGILAPLVQLEVKE